jgi:hypothetical protein
MDLLYFGLSIRFLNFLLSGRRFLLHANGKVRAVEFAPAAAGAAFRVLNHWSPVLIQAETLPGAKGCTDTAGLAPIPEDVDFKLRVRLFRNLFIFLLIHQTITLSTEIKGIDGHLANNWI